MSLDVTLSAVRKTDVYRSNITHNLGQMARAAGIYMQLWRPDELEPPITKAAQLIEPLKLGLDYLIHHPHELTKLNPTNGWGTYERLVQFVKDYLAACQENPDADVEVSR